MLTKQGSTAPGPYFSSYTSAAMMAGSFSLSLESTENPAHWILLSVKNKHKKLSKV